MDTYYLHLLGLLFETEDGGYIFLRNVDCLSPDYTALYSRLHNYSIELLNLKNMHLLLFDVI
jgi:hypothetical protein